MWRFQPLRVGGWRRMVTQHKGRQPEYLVQRRGEWIFRTYTITAAFVWRIRGFRFYRGAADTYMSPQKKGPQLAITPTVTWRTMASEITAARFAIPDKCSVADLTPPPLLFLSSPSQSLSVKWHTGERAKWLCLLTGASEHLKWQRVTLAWVLEKMPGS